MNAGLILAGGTGQRMGTETPKQFMILAGKPLILYSIEAFDRCPQIDAIGIVCLRGWQQKLNQLLLESGIRKVRWFIDAQPSRSLSSYHGLLAMEKDMGFRDIVLIHDAARPLVEQRVIAENIKIAQRFGGCNTAYPCVDTILLSSDGQTVEQIPDRSALYSSQTPQSFRYGPIMQAYRDFCAGGGEATCDASVAQRSGIGVGICIGSRRNIKVTTPEDLPLAELYLQTLQT